MINFCFINKNGRHDYSEIKQIYLLIGFRYKMENSEEIDRRLSRDIIEPN